MNRGAGWCTGRDRASTGRGRGQGRGPGRAAAGRRRRAAAARRRRARARARTRAAPTTRAVARAAAPAPGTEPVVLIGVATGAAAAGTSAARTTGRASTRTTATTAAAAAAAATSGATTAAASSTSGATTARGEAAPSARGGAVEAEDDRLEAASVISATEEVDGTPVLEVQTELAAPDHTAPKDVIKIGTATLVIPNATATAVKGSMRRKGMWTEKNTTESGPMAMNLREIILKKNLQKNLPKNKLFEVPYYDLSQHLSFIYVSFRFNKVYFKVLIYIYKFSSKHCINFYCKYSYTSNNSHLLLF